MAMKRCPVCGEMYSDTYKRCPFCEEAELLKSGDTSRRKGGHRVAQNSSPSLLSPLLILAILIMVGVLVYLLFGNTIASKLGLNDPAVPESSISAQAPSVSGGSHGSASSATASSGAVSGSQNGTGTQQGTATPQGPAPATSVKLEQKDFTISTGETYDLEASGGGEKYTWQSDDDGVVRVDDKGTVTAISGGAATITVSDGYTKAECIVRVKDGSSSGAKLTLNKSDVTIKVGERYTLQASGGSGVSWSSSNNSVVSVSGGTVRGVAKGSATVTASAGGKSVSCIVRVK